MTWRAVAVAVVVMLAGVGSAARASAYTCPVLIKQAEDTIAKAERTQLLPEGRTLLEDAKKLVAEARRHHETARAKKDHDDAVRKAKTAQGLAEEALKLQAR